MGIVEEIVYNLEGEEVKKTYSVLIDDEYSHLMRFNSYQDAREYIRKKEGV